jgi:phosphonate transport system substrate-binding protein
MKALFPLFFHLALLSLVILWQAVPVQSSSAEERVYSFGVVPQFEARKLRKVWQPIVNYLAKETGYTFKILGSPTIGEFEQELLQGDFDFAYMNPLHLVLANEQEGYLPLVRDYGKKLYGIVVVKKESNITDVSQLDGKTIAFPAPRALGATLLVKQELDNSYKIKIHSIYAKTHDSVYLNVLLGNAAAGGGVQQTFARQPAEYRAALRVIYKTKKVPCHPIAVHPAVPHEVATAVRLALLKLGADPEGKSLLAAIPMQQIISTDLSEYLPLKAAGLERYYENKAAGPGRN